MLEEIEDTVNINKYADTILTLQQNLLLKIKSTAKTLQDQMEYERFEN